MQFRFIQKKDGVVKLASAKIQIQEKIDDFFFAR